MKKLLIFIILSISYMTLSYADQLKIITSFSILGDWAQKIGGNKIEVQNLVGPNHNTHHYEMTASDQIALKNADLIFIQGLHFESEDIQRAVKGYPNKLVRVSNVFTSKDLIPLIRYHFNDTEVKEMNSNETRLFDPHTWHNIELAKKSIETICQYLIQKNPSNWKYYYKNYIKYLAELTELEKWAHLKFKEIDQNNHLLITIHAGFRYLANFYGLEYLSLETNHEHGEISAKQVSGIINSINQKNVKYIFAEKNANLKIAQLISKHTKIPIVGELYSDFLSDEAPTYLELMRHNIDVITLYLKRK